MEVKFNDIQRYNGLTNKDLDEGQRQRQLGLLTDIDRHINAHIDGERETSVDMPVPPFTNNLP